MVATDKKHERSSLTKRLSFLGVNYTTDFNDQHMHTCMVSINYEVFLSIKAYLTETTFVLAANNRQNYKHSRGTTANNPVKTLN
jgi:hypothetical protein